MNIPGQRRPWYVKVVALLAVLLTAWHVFASFLWIAPYNYMREIVPGNALSNYMIPMFGQSWSVFAPEPINGDYKLRVRAETNINGTLTATKWVDVTETELAQWKTHNLFPPRASGFAMQQASGYKGVYDKLSPDQQKIAAGGYYKGADSLERLERDIRAQAAKPSVTDSVNNINISKFMAEERRTAAFVTQVARAVWGADVEHIQFEVSRQNVIPFQKRNDENAQKPAAVVLGTGWRAVTVEDLQDGEEFREVFPGNKALETSQ